MLDFNDHDPAVPSPNGNAERDELRSALLARLEREAQRLMARYRRKYAPGASA